MSILRRGKGYYLKIAPFGKQVMVRTSAQTKHQALDIERAVLSACKAGDYRSLDVMSREVCLRMFQNQRIEIPDGLSGADRPGRELSLWDSVQLFVNYPPIRQSRTLERYTDCLTNLVDFFGKDRPIKGLWVPDIRHYQATRVGEGASPATVNKERGVLSKLFIVLQELQLVQDNPAKLVPRLSEKSGERQVYISLSDFEAILVRLPAWFQPIAQVAHYSAMRKGEITGLKAKQADLNRRMVYLGPEDTKERAWKRVPLRQELIPVFHEALKVRPIGDDTVFLAHGKPLSKGMGRKQWERAVRDVGLSPTPVFHDLRGTWKTNARRSGIDPEVRESIMGHWSREKTVAERYGRISDMELVQAVDQMTFDHGRSEIWLARQ